MASGSTSAEPSAAEVVTFPAPAGASAEPSAADARRMQFQVRQVENQLHVKTISGERFSAVLINVPMDELQEMPDGPVVRQYMDDQDAGRLASSYMVISEVMCQVCKNDVHYEHLSKLGQQRAQRRLERLVNTPSHLVDPGHGRVLCVGCAGSNPVPPKTWLSNMSLRGALKVTVRYSVMVEDEDFCVGVMTSHFQLGHRNQKEVEATVFEEVGRLAQEYVHEKENHMEEEDDDPMGSA